MWNYRVFKVNVNNREYYCLKEAYYNPEGDVISWTEDTETGYFEDIDSMASTHDMMTKDITKYRDMVLDEAELLKRLEKNS